METSIVFTCSFCKKDFNDLYKTSLSDWICGECFTKWWNDQWTKYGEMPTVQNHQYFTGKREKDFWETRCVKECATPPFPPKKTEVSS